MIVPEYWAEASRHHRDATRRITVRRFGWSDVSEHDAQNMAEARAEEALQEAIAGRKLERRERKVTYGGAQGLPIREEILARAGDAVITRNGYGARCLNTPDALFADIDFPVSGSLKLKFGIFFVLAAAAAVLVWGFDYRWLGLALAVLAPFVSAPLGDQLFSWRLAASGGAEPIARSRLASFLAAHPDWNVRLYRTPAGLRLLATHEPLAPDNATVEQFLRAVDSDPLYITMCRNQHCFRARLSAKPWRIGVQTHMKPRPGVWPVSAERRPERAAWIADYEAKAGRYAACAFVESLGSGKIHSKLAPLVELHDRECRALAQGVPLA
jgi:hypothetical protein